MKTVFIIENDNERHTIENVSLVEIVVRTLYIHHDRKVTEFYLPDVSYISIA